MEGYCIEDAHAHNETSAAKLPSKTFFVGSLFGHEKRLTESWFEGLAKKLGIGNVASSSSTEEEHANHNHKRKRSLDSFLAHNPGSRVRRGISRRAVDDHDHDHDKDKDGDHADEHSKNFNKTVSY